METDRTGDIVCSVVVPLYNEEEVIGESYKRLTAVMEGEGIPYELIMVNDGSRDRTEELARAICTADKRVKLINFARNFGHQTAITAGMDAAGGQCVVVIDADLQDPPEVIPEMKKIIGDVVAVSTIEDMNKAFDLDKRRHSGKTVMVWGK